MGSNNFDENIDNTLLAIEDAIDESGEDIDYDTIAGILTLSFPDDTKIIINRQSATSQLWIAARSGGFHLDWVDGQWQLKQDGTDLPTLINTLCSQQLGTTVELQLN